METSGLQAFANPDTFDVSLLAIPGWTEPSVLNNLIKVCEGRSDCLGICDTPFGLKPQQVVDWSNGAGIYDGRHQAFNSSYVAFYWSWLLVRDSSLRKDIWLPPSGFVLSCIAYNDRVAECWFAPAGLIRARIPEALAVEYSPNRPERDLLYGDQNVINSIVKFKKDGICIYGQRTAQRRATALDRVNVRRLSCYMRKIVAASTQYFVFEQNDAMTWDLWTMTVEPAIRKIKEKRGLYDYRVEMSDRTVTDYDIDTNTMPGRIQFKPTKVAEFIPLDFILLNTGAMFL